MVTIEIENSMNGGGLGARQEQTATSLMPLIIVQDFWEARYDEVLQSPK